MSRLVEIAGAKAAAAGPDRERRSSPLIGSRSQFAEAVGKIVDALGDEVEDRKSVV